MLVSPPYDAVIVSGPAAEGVKVTAHDPLFRVQVVIENDPALLALKVTVPVGEAPVTMTVQLMAVLAGAVVGEQCTLVWLTNANEAVFDDGALAESPTYDAVMGCADGGCVDEVTYFTAHDDVVVESLQLVDEKVPAPGVVKLTMPVGETPETVALHVTVRPAFTGSGEQATEVDDVAGVTDSDFAPIELELLVSPP